AYVGRLGAVVVEAGLDVQHVARRPGGAGELGVVDAAQRAIERLVDSALADIDLLELDPDPEIDPDLAHRVAEVLERALLVAAAVAHHDHVAAPAHHLVQAEI